MSTPNPERIARLQQELRENGLDALVCTLPSNVLMMTGYWPVVGTSIAVATTGGEVAVLIPEDERELTENSWATTVATYQPGSLEKLEAPVVAAGPPLRELMRRLGMVRTRIGYEFGAFSEPASYASMNLFGASVVALLHEAAPDATIVPADESIERLASVKTETEIDRIRLSCVIAQASFERGREHLHAGMSESQVAVLFRAGLSTHAAAISGAQRADGFVFCMSGPNSAEAFGAYARSRWRVVVPGDLVLVHCNSYADGYWTDITRTYVVGTPDQRQHELYDAVFAARAAALAHIRPGVTASDVDRAARDALRERRVADAFKHSTGHGIGFAAISANAHPRIHPKCSERLETGMVFNVEPAVYFEGYGGLRHCDMVAVTGSGYELLTPFQLQASELVVH